MIVRTIRVIHVIVVGNGKDRTTDPVNLRTIRAMREKGSRFSRRNHARPRHISNCIPCQQSIGIPWISWISIFSCEIKSSNYTRNWQKSIKEFHYMQPQISVCVCVCMAIFLLYTTSKFNVSKLISKYMIVRN